MILNSFRDQFARYHSPDCPNFFCVVRTPGQAIFESYGTELPISDFSTGFKDATDTELRLWARNKISELREHGNEGMLQSYWIAVMDEQSEQDSTIVLHYNEELSLWAQCLEDAELPFNIPGDADVSEDEIWWRWRLPISGAHHLFNGVEDGDFVMIELFSRPEYVGPNRVVNIDIPVEIIRGEIPDSITQKMS
ncbi:hypothetical protein BO83DRAFT_389561 [Aspergillus eucalypticola CBS 122712]|uniref:Uncharacterized protein n=1 Tax=Aspergillus eucalypticola (strain CBS 122712 / IBT 29274) TaxID=1448314 RepID=A0A317VHB1_ASPEC|nr:uncharacterized protein BO83DRAFT_389561 [Aspergillus eucalypticola CBS 122712]PWY71250.1 hypothetical protein BO83DRAFT_389561 [Aspergillus eucalypticola CBS 122712]